MHGDALDRFARHIILKEFGGLGQQELIASDIALIGLGGIGSPALQYLAASGVGQLRLIDDDKVDFSNLPRQTIFSDADIGSAKAEAAATAVRSLHPGSRASVHAERLDASNAARLLEGADLVIDGSDNFETRLVAADTALALRIPLVSAAVAEFRAQVALYRGWEPDKPCYRCLVGSDPALPDASCAAQGVLAPVAGLAGCLAAIEAMRAITGFGTDTAGSLLIVDMLAGSFRRVTVRKDPLCPSCAA